MTSNKPDNGQSAQQREEQTGNSVPDLELALREFCKHLFRERSDHLGNVAGIWGGFEGWLKFELCFWLIDEYDLKAGTDVGVEYKAALMKTADRNTKQVDVWVRANGVDRWHYVELKVVFNNPNQEKVAAGAFQDLRYLQHISASEHVEQRALLVFGAGFHGELDWRRCVGRICPDTNWPDWNRSLPPDAGIRAAIWTGAGTDR